MIARWILGAALSLNVGCGDDPLHRMGNQQKFEAYEANPFFADGRAMRTPPPGTVPFSARGKSPALLTGKANGALVTRVPLPITRELVARGRDRYDIYCSVCHGLTGDGQSLVGRNMALVPPPSLLAHAHHPDGYYFQVITEGRGLMSSYAAQLSVEDRWAVVAYVRALQISQHAPLALAPPEEQARLTSERGP